MSSQAWNVVKELKPSLFWKRFYELSLIPRPSKKEERVGQYLMDMAKKLKVEDCHIDEVGNVIYRIEGSKGFENIPMLTLQSHQDMVCVSDKDHDFDNDPITFVRLSDDWICADKTTLGADNGVGVACTLMIFEQALNNEFPHGPIEALFTVDEETGLNGVKKLDPNIMKGKYLINLDSEEWGDVFVGCAGGARSNLFMKPEFETSQDVLGKYTRCMEIELKGLLGGHSGIDIVLERNNANKFLSIFLRKLDLELRKNNLNFSLLNFTVDSNYNEIPSNGRMTLLYEGEDDKKVIEDVIKGHTEEMIVLYKSVEDDKFSFGIAEDGEIPNIKEETLKKVWSRDFTRVLYRLLIALPNGVERMSHDLDGNIVETSNNVANCYCTDEEVKIGLCTRSMKEDAILLHLDKIQCTCELLLCSQTITSRFERGTPYPGWAPVMESKLLRIVEETYKKKLGGQGDPDVKACHAGLECGYILKKKPLMEAVSIGPTIVSPHSTKEKLNIPTTVLFCELVRDIIVEFTKKSDW